MMKFEHYSSITDEMMQALLREALPIQDGLIIGMISQDSPITQGEEKSLPQIMAVVWIDTTQRPDIRDLGRVHAMEGEGEIMCTWTYIDEMSPESYFVLAVAMQRPVKISFSIAIHLPEYAALLEIVSRTGSFSLVPGPPVEWRRLIHQIPFEGLLDRIYQQGGDDTTIMMSRKTTAELRRHFETWLRHRPARE